MGDRLRAGKPPQYFTKPPRSIQSPTLSGTGNEYLPECSDALRLGVKDWYGSFHLWINVWVASRHVVISSSRALSERLRDEQLIVVHCIPWASSMLLNLS